MPPYGIRFSPSKRGVVGAATYRICANIVGDLLPQGAAVRTAPFREGGGAVRRQGESAQRKSWFLFRILIAKPWVRQLYEIPYFAKSPQFRGLPHPLPREPPPGGGLPGVHRSPAIPAKSNPVGGHFICPRPDTKLLFPFCHQIPYLFFFF